MLTLVSSHGADRQDDHVCLGNTSHGVGVGTTRAVIAFAQTDVDEPDALVQLDRGTLSVRPRGKTVPPRRIPSILASSRRSIPCPLEIRVEGAELGIMSLGFNLSTCTERAH